MALSTEQQKKLERETEGYKMFMKVAKKLSYLEYGKWTMAPDVNDPLRKFTISKDIGWTTLSLCLVMESFYHRGVYTGDRWDYRCLIGVNGLFMGSKPLKLNCKLKPRMAPRLLKLINEVIVPKFYDDIMKEDAYHQDEVVTKAKFAEQVKKVEGLVYQPGVTWNSNAVLNGCPFLLEAHANIVTLRGELSYDDLATIAKAMKWGNYK